MSTITTPDVGRVFIPALSRVTFGPAFPTGRSRHYAGVVSYTVRDHGYANQKGWGLGVPQLEGLAEKWRQDETLQRLFASPAAFAAALRTKFGFSHNERIQNGGKMVAKILWGASSSPTQSSVNPPTYIALNNNAAFTSGNFTYAHDGTDQSLGNGATIVGSGVTTNEYTTAGLSRAIGTLSAYTDPSALDGQFSLQVAKTFTCTSGPQTVYGAGLVDASSTTVFNLYAEAPFTSATLQTNDTLSTTWSVSD